MCVIRTKPNLGFITNQYTLMDEWVRDLRKDILGFAQFMIDSKARMMRKRGYASCKKCGLML